MNEYYKKDLYKILGVDPDCDVAKIKLAYRKQARKWHPDVNDNSEESIVRFKEITEAYEVLTDAQKRSQYDILKGFNTGKGTTSSSSDANNSYYSKSQEKTAKKAYTESAKYSSNGANSYETGRKYDSKKFQKEENETKSSFSQVFENILDGLFTSGSGARNTDKTKSQKAKSQSAKSSAKSSNAKPIKGADINLNITIKMSETISGTNRTVNVLHTERCPKCGGRRFINGSKCSLCKGTGEISNHKKLNVKIPIGVKKGTKIRIPNEGNKGYNGGRNGDLFLLIDVEENSFYKFEGINVYCEIPITPYEAALGATIDVPTLCGNVSMKIPPNTSTGQKFRLSQQGVYDEKNKTRGDQIVVVKIEMPKNLSATEKKLYEQLRDISSHNIRENLLNDN